MMNNKHFIQELSRRSGYTMAETQKIVSAFVSAMSDSFQEGELGFKPIASVKEKLKKGGLRND